jgi:hypothetical protein
MPGDTDAEIVALRTVLSDLALVGSLQLDFVFARLRVPSAVGEVDATPGNSCRCQ